MAKRKRTTSSSTGRRVKKNSRLVDEIKPEPVEVKEEPLEVKNENLDDGYNDGNENLTEYELQRLQMYVG